MSRIRRPIALWTVALLAASLLAAAAAAQPQAGGQAPAAATAPAAGVPPAAPQPPVHITSDAAEYFNAESLVVFTGSVVATQGDTTLTGERLEVGFTAPATPPSGKPGSLTDAQTGRKISSLTATKNVTFRQVDPESGKERYATGEKGVYEADARIVTLTGSPRLWENKNVIVGEEMVFHLDDKKVVVRGKVNLTVYPEDGAGGATPK